MRALFILLIISFPFIGSSQDSELGNWFVFIGSKKLDNNWNWHHEVQHRNYNAAGDLEQLLLRTGLGKNLTQGNNNLLFGYGYILSSNYIDDDEKVDVNEHRLFLQFISKQKWGRLGIQHRYRFEQRWVESDFRLRFRYFLAANYPLNNSTLVTGTTYLSTYNEIFLNTRGNAFDRNRLYGGLGYKASDHLRIELGYMNQFLNGGNRDQINIIAFLNW